jgi:[acyl-carrier-protein] S-malonyltransferase
VSAPFHCSLMQPAQERLAADLKVTEFRHLTVPLLNNWRAEVIHTGAEAREGLFEQVPNPVRWMDVIQKMASLGVKRFVEVGPGNVLTGLLRNIDRGLEGSRFGEVEDLEKVYAAKA